MPLRSFTQAEIVLSHRRHLELPLLATVWLGVTAFSLAEGSLFYLLAGTLAVGVNALAASRDREVYVHRSFVNASVLAATAVMIIELIGATELLVALGHYLILIQLCKLFERKRDRDYVQLLTMSILLMVAGTMVCQSLWFAGLVLLCIVLVCYTAMVFTLKRGLDAAASARLAAESDPMGPHVVAWNVIMNWPGQTLRRRLLTIALAILATGVAVFLLAPRPVWGGAGIAGLHAQSHISGFSGRLRLGEANRIYLSNEIVMTLTVRPDNEGKCIPSVPLYLRGRTFETYSNSNWSSSARAVPGLRPADAGGETVIQEVTLTGRVLPTLFTAYPTVRCECEDGTVQVDGNLNVTLSHFRPNRTVRYTAWSWLRPLSDAQREFLREHFDGPRGDPAGGAEATAPVKQLARKWCKDLLAEREGLPDGPELDNLNLRVAERIAEKLRSNYDYTLDLSASNPQRDAVEDFLFHMKKGHCEYFASALAVMCRSLGVHARVAAGFRSEGPVAAGETISLRASDAHAWTEIYTPSTHWRIMDATPAGRWQQQGHWWEVFGDFWASLKFFWARNVVGYDDAARASIGRWLARSYLAVKTAAVQSFNALRDGFINFFAYGHIDEALLYFLLVMSLLGTLLLMIGLWRLVRRKLRYRGLLREGKTVPWPQLRFFARLTLLLRRRGMELRADETAREHIAQAVERFNLPADVMGELVELYYSLRWGRARPSAEEIRAAEDHVTEIASILKTKRRR
ncbi:MAG: transglutaminase TgpA family protein [Planctomycetota bacterium]|jgi:transglutaminase-like putative cysteine protease